MKIGLLTLYYGGNFGTYFQASCLQKQIQNLGHECELINATVRGLEPWRYYLLRCFNRFVPRRIKNILHKKLNFYSGYCTLENETKRLPKSKINFALKRLSKNYDGIILGSDEIWSTNASEVRSSLVFWGKDVQCPIVSYASSGINWKPPKKNMDIMYKKLYNKMLYIGVRDKHTYNIVKSYVTQNIVKIVVDPTILNPFYIQKTDNTEETILIYGPEICKEMKKHIKQYALKENLQIFCMGWYHSWCDKFIEPKSSLEVQKMFASSKYIISSSFHGTIFAIMHRKQFISLKINERKEKIEDLLIRLHLEKRLTDTNILLLEEKIDYEKVFQNIENLRNESLEVLKKELELIKMQREEIK